MLLVPTATMVAILPAVPAGWALSFGAAVVTATSVGLVSTLVYRGTSLTRVSLDPFSVLAGFIFLWHFSFFLVLMAGMASGFRVEAYLEMAPEENNRALALCGIGLLAFLGGGDLVARPRWHRLCEVHRPLVGWFAVASAYVGAALCVVYFAGPGRRLVGNYHLVFLESDPLRRIYNLGVLVTAVGTAVYLLVNAPRVRRLLQVVPPVLAVMAVGVMIGSRWVAISMLLAVVMAVSLRGWRPRTLPFALAAVVLAFGAIAVKNYRLPGVGAGGMAFGSIAPIIGTFEEIGQAYRSTVGTVGRYGPERENYEMGSTLLPAVLSIVPSLPERVIEVRRPNEELAEEYFYQQYRDEGYTLGFSLIAELYLNFGPWGVFVGMAALGWAVAEAQRRGLEWGSTVWAAGVVVAVLILWFGVRNDTFTWFRNLTWGLGLVLLLHALDFRGRSWIRT